jgi:acyl carrier protein
VSRLELQASALAILRRVLPVAPATTNPDQLLRDQIEMDSLDFLNFVVALEKEHGVSIPPSRYPACASLAGAATVLEQALAAVPSAGVSTARP